LTGLGGAQSPMGSGDGAEITSTEEVLDSSSETTTTDFFLERVGCTRTLGPEESREERSGLDEIRGEEGAGPAVEAGLGALDDEGSRAPI